MPDIPPVGQKPVRYNRIHRISKMFARIQGRYHPETLLLTYIRNSRISFHLVSACWPPLIN